MNGLREWGRWMPGLVAAWMGALAAGCGKVPEAGAPVVFHEVTEAAGLGGFRHTTGAFGALWFPEIMGAGGGFLDYDGDGWMDVLLVAGGTWPGHGEPVPALRLYRNEGDGTFSDRTAGAGLASTFAYGFGVTVADYDNDGDADFFLTTLHENLLFRNNGDGRFTEVGRAAGVAGPPEWSTAAVFLDADRDGHLDLYVGNYVAWSPETDIVCTLKAGLRGYCTPELYTGLPGRFYRNNGDGTFTERTAEAGLAGAPGKTLAAVSLDYNHDGWPDLAVANDTERDLLYENRGDGTFIERGVISGFAYDEHGRARAGMGLDAGVIDTTGQVTVFVANFAGEMIGAYRHEGDGFFVDRARTARIGTSSLNLLTFALFLFDADLDGHLDLFTVNGHINPEIERVQDGTTFRQPARLFLNRGNGTFEAVRPRDDDDVWSLALVGRGAAYADYDRDGDLDLLVTENGGPVHLWRNAAGTGREGAPKSWLRLRLEGRESNRDGLGARVVARVENRKLEHYVRSGAGYLSQVETTVTFGLGSAPAVDSLWIYWPSGVVDVLAGPAANQEIRVVEGTGRYEQVPRPARR
ncbi:MAG: RNA-binding protein [Rhodothermaceae bacterium]|nr:MAG: RNA-binding protein [Rhodothermaceae bacterium]